MFALPVIFLSPNGLVLGVPRIPKRRPFVTSDLCRSSLFLSKLDMRILLFDLAPQLSLLK